MSEPFSNLLPDQRRRATAERMAAQWDRPTYYDQAPVERAGLLPLGTYPNGQTGLAFPGFITEPIESWNRMYAAAHAGEKPSPEDAFNVAGAAMVGGLAAPRPRPVHVPAPRSDLMEGVTPAVQQKADALWNAIQQQRKSSALAGTQVEPMPAAPQSTTGLSSIFGQMDASAKAFDNSLGGLVDDYGAWAAKRNAALDDLSRSSQGQSIEEPAYHGSWSRQLMSPRARAIRETLVDTGPWGSSSKDIANTYTSTRFVESPPGPQDGSMVMPVDFRFKNPMIYDAQGHMWDDLPVVSTRGYEGAYPVDTDLLSSAAKERGHDGLVVRNVRDELEGTGGSPATTYHALRPGTVYSSLTGDLLYANGGRQGAALNLLSQYYGQPARHWSDSMREGDL